MFCALTALAVACSGATVGTAVAADRQGMIPPSVTQANWKTHPKIEAIRRVVEANEAAIKDHLWTRQEKRICIPDGERSFALERIADVDQAGRIRKYTVIEGTDDSAYKLEHHFDGQGRIRFCFGTGGAVNGASLEVRLYFAEDGKRIWMDRRETDLKYTFLEGWPEKFVVRMAEEAFRSPPPPECSNAKQ